MSERVDLREFIGGFVAEADELVSTAQTLLLELETANAQGTVRPRAVRDLFRALHTIKGLAGMVGIEPIVEIAHALETLLRAADRSGGKLRRGGIEVTIQGVHAIGERVRAVAEARAVAPAPDALLAALAGTDAASEAPLQLPAIASAWDSRLTASERQQLFEALRQGSKVWSVTFVPTEALAARGITIAIVRGQLAALGEIIKVAPRAGSTRGVAFDFLIASEASPEQLAEQAATTIEHVEAIAAPPDLAAASAPETDSLADDSADIAPMVGRSIVRVELSRLDELQEQLSLLIVSKFRLEREIAAQRERGVDVRRLREVLDLQGRQLRDLRRAILRVRMVKVSELLDPLALLVRSLTRPGYKEIRLELDANGAEVDKAVADRILPALVHLVRNAIDHAIEPLADRVAAGKPPVGTVRVACSEIAGNRLELVVGDDGAGIDRAAIERRANRSLEGNAELLDALATPGFSTRDVVSETSGRGLGMDIVKRIVVSELGGVLELDTIVGTGTTFRLEVPLTIAIVEVFSFECGNQPFVVPVTGIEEIFELAHDREVMPPRRGDGAAISLFEWRGKAVPLVSLGAMLAISDGASARKAIVVRRSGELIAFAIDRMLGRHEVVVRALADPLTRTPGVAGATDLGDGRPTLVLDLCELGMRLGVTGRSA